MAPTSLTWPLITPGGSATGADNDPVLINNTGNDSPPTIRVNSTDLLGEDDSSNVMEATDFTVGIASDGCGDDAMVNITAVTITSASLANGYYPDDSSAQEDLFFCLNTVDADLINQTYSTSGAGTWTIDVVAE